MAEEERSPFWRTWFPFSTSGWIRDHLIEKYPDSDYVHQMYQEFQKEITKWWLERGKEPGEFKVGTYQNFRNYIWWLKKLGLIEKVKSEPSEKPQLQDRNHYRIVWEKKDDDAWSNPRKALYPESYEKKH